MKYLYTILFIIFTLPAYSEKLSLCDIPWTDAAYSWTWDGMKLPVKNQNLFGSKITISGDTFEKGIAGHTGFSVVYNLSGQAVSFSALAGIDDQAHPRDPQDMKTSSVKVVILVDRVKVSSKIVHLNEKAVPIKIDLKGKEQLELRGEYCTGFYKQRIVFVNPELTVINKKEFIKQALAWQQKVEKEKTATVKYPIAPEWKNIGVEKIKWNHWENAYKINNNKLELIILPEFGGRIISLRKTNGQNLLLPNGKTERSNLIHRGLKHQHGGHFSRPQPLNYFHPASPELILGKYSISFPEQGHIIMTSPKCFVSFLQYRYEIKITPDTNYFTLITTHINLAPFEQLAGIWSITRLPVDKIEKVEAPINAENAPLAPIFNPKNIQAMFTKNNIWQSINLNTPAAKKILSKKRSCIEWQEFPMIPQTRVLFKDGTSLLKSFTYHPDDNRFYKQFRPVHFYACSRFLENEIHGPTKVLPLSGEISLHERWEIKHK